MIICTVLQEALHGTFRQELIHLTIVDGQNAGESDAVLVGDSGT